MNMRSMSDRISLALPFHYGWVIMGTGTLCLFACLGLGRFSLGMILPSMGGALSLSYAEMGFLSTANFVGYLIAVLSSGLLMRAFGSRLTITVSLLGIGVSMICIGRSSSLELISVLYVLTGLGSGFANVPMIALISCWFGSNLRGRATGFVVIGNGLAILLCGWLVPAVNGWAKEGWRMNWTILGILVLVCACICWLLVRNSPQQMGVPPVGEKDFQDANPVGVQEPVRLQRGRILHCSIIYFLFGCASAIYITFVVIAIVRDWGYPESLAGVFWSWIGLTSLVSGPVPGFISDRIGRKKALIMIFSVQALSYLFLSVHPVSLFLFVSITCYGIVAWAAPSVMAALVGDYVGAMRMATVFGFVTFIFGLGQIIGPVLGGIFAERSGSFSSCFLLALICACVAIFLSFLLPEAKNIRGEKKNTRSSL